MLRGERFNYTVNSSMTDVKLDILRPFTPYEFRVFGITSSWEGSITDTIGVKTQEDGRFIVNRSLRLPLLKLFVSMYPKKGEISPDVQLMRLSVE